MDAQEFTAQVDELEKKLDRLRALYEQYFMGIEKIEPQVLRKDVERHLHALHKERVRNTAVRFRFQTLVQRHTTLMAYWLKVCRAIEEGTYHPHIMRAQRMMRAQDEAEGAARSVRTFSISPDGELILDVVLASQLPPPPEPEEHTGPVARARSLGELRTLLETAEAAAKRGSSAPPPPGEAGHRPRPGISRPPPSRATPSPVPDTPPAAEPMPPPAGPRPGRVSGAPTRPALAPPPDPHPEPSPPAVDAPPGGGAAPPRAFPSSPAPPLSPVKVSGLPSPVPAKVARVPSLAPGKAAGVPSVAPGARPRTEPPAAGAGATSGVPEDKIRAIHAAFVQAASRAPGGAPVPSLDALRRSLDKELHRMRERHPGRKIDFRVAVKGGRPVVKSFVAEDER